MSDATNKPQRDWDARLYEDKHSFVWKHGASLVELLAPQAGERVLDLGCGTGHLTAQIAAAGADVVGIDSSPDMIDQARRKYPQLRFAIADAQALSFQEEFDAVFSNAVLHWVTEAGEVVHGVARTLKPGGRFIAEFGGRGNVKAILAAMQRAARSMGCGTVESPWYFPSICEYGVLLENAGLEVTFATLFDRPTPLQGEGGMRHWLEMFGGYFLAAVSPGRREEFLGRVEDNLRGVLWQDGSWFADYCRLRVAARKTEEKAGFSS